MRLAPLALVALLLLAGCGGLGDGTPPTDVRTTEITAETPTGPETTGDAPDTPADASTPTATPTDTPTATGTPTALDPSTGSLSDDNPWDRKVIPVAVNDTVDDGRDTTAIVRRALAYWNANVERYTDYALRFELTDDREDARISVRFVERIDECDGPANDTAGCARLLEPDQQPRDLEVARVESNGSNAAVLGTTQHELGHLLGLDHEDRPRFLMAQDSDEPIPDASERANPWYGDVVRVAVDSESIDGDPSTVEDQVNHAIEFYDDGARGTVPENVTVRRTDSQRTAEVLVTSDPATCDVDGGSQISLQGRNSDGDRALEAHTGATVCLDVDAQAVGWHVGYWLGTAFGLGGGERAPAFRDASYEERRSDWWR